MNLIIIPQEAISEIVDTDEPYLSNAVACFDYEDRECMLSVIQTDVKKDKIRLVMLGDNEDEPVLDIELSPKSFVKLLAHKTLISGKYELKIGL